MSEKQLNNPLTLTTSSELFGKDGDEFGKFNAGFLGIHNLLHIQDKRPAATNGGTVTSGAWRTRPLNTILTNGIGGSLNINQVTIPAGSYYVEGSAVAFYVDHHCVRLAKVSPSVEELLIGRAMMTNPSTHIGNVSTLSGSFSISASSVIELQHIAMTTGTNTGFGYVWTANTFLAELKIWKLS